MNARWLFPLLLALGLVGCGGTVDAGPPPVSTYTGAPSGYAGNGVLLVITWADWASVWPLLRDEVAAFRTSAPEGVEFQFVNVDEQREIPRQLGADIVPSVVIIKRGAVVEVLPNVTTADQLHRAVQNWLAG